MAEGGDINKFSDSELESSTGFSVEGVDGNELFKSNSDGTADKNKSGHIKLTKNPQGSFGNNNAESDECSISILSVTGANESNSIRNNSQTLNSSFLSVKKAEGNITLGTVRTLDRSTFNKEGRTRKVQASECITYSKSDDNECLCHFCFRYDIKCKATHSCNICGRMCWKCLRSHVNFTDHRNVISLSKYTESLDLAGGREECKVNKDCLPQDKATQNQQSRSKSKVDRVNILSKSDRHACSTIDFAQMRNGNMIIADFGNKCLKILESDTLLVKEVFYLKENPVCITCFPDDTVAVAYSDTLSLETFDRCRKTLNVYRLLSVCKGLKNVNHYLYSLEGEPSIVFIYYLQDQTNLKQVQTINLNQCGINNAEQIDINESGDKMFITDEALRLYVLNNSGNVLTCLAVNIPRGVSSEDSKNVLICYFDTNRVLEISHLALNNDIVLSDKNVELAPPFSVFVDRKRKRLFVGMFKKNFVLYADILD